MIRTFLLGAFAASFLSACEVPVMIAASQNQGQMTGAFEITFPAVLLVQFADGDEELLTGDLIGHANGNARFTLANAELGQCEGTATRDGDTRMRCSNGVEIAMNTGRQRAKMSGINVFQGSEFKSAFGWGNEASEGAVRAALGAL